jgi:serine/threonine protein kinase
MSAKSETRVRFGLKKGCAPRRSLRKPESAKLESRLTRFARVRPSIRPFEKPKIIGRDGSAVVGLVRDRMDAAFYAMQIINKLNITVNEQVDSIRSERNALASLENPWIAKLSCSFQDAENLYFVVECLQGGDLRSLLSSMRLDSYIATLNRIIF